MRIVTVACHYRICIRGNLCRSSMVFRVLRQLLHLSRPVHSIDTVRQLSLSAKYNSRMVEQAKKLAATRAIDEYVQVF